MKIVSSVTLLGTLAAASLVFAACETTDSAPLEDTEYEVAKTALKPTRTNFELNPFSGDPDNPVVCKTIQKPGSRFSSEVCAEESEWQAVADSASELLEDIRRP